MKTPQDISDGDIPWDLADPPSRELSVCDACGCVVVDLIIESMSYRLLAQQAIHYSHQLASDAARRADRDRLRDRLRDIKQNT